MCYCPTLFEYLVLSTLGETTPVKKNRCSFIFSQCIFTRLEVTVKVWQ